MSTTEVFNASQVKSVMSEIGSEFSDLSSLVEETNSLVTSALGSPDKAVYGDAGNKILATWDENCSTLSSFINIFNNWSLVAVSVASEYGKLDTGTAKVEGTDLEAFKAISGANKTTWLKTSEGASNYTGSKNSYMDPTTNNIVSEQSSLSNRREITYTDASGNKITEYYNLAGVLMGIKKNGKLYDANGKSVSEIGTKDEFERADKIKKAQTSLKDSVKTKHEEEVQKEKERKEKEKERKEQAASSDWAIGPYNSILHMNQHEANSGYNERQRRIAFLGGMKSSDSEQRSMMTNIQVPVWNGQNETTINLFVNKKLVDNYQKAFREVCDLKFPIMTNPQQSANCAYSWDHWRPGGERSDHAYGGTFDINTSDNFGRGKNNQYSLRTRPDVVKAFEKQGFFWGGNWESGEDDMHFSFTGY